MKRDYILGAILGVVVASCSAFCNAPYAAAEERVLPAGTEVETQEDGEPVTLRLEETHFLVERESLDRANAAAALNERLQRELKECSATVAKVTGPEPAWQKALRWGLTGAAVGLAFGAGVAVGGGL